MADEKAAVMKHGKHGMDAEEEVVLAHCVDLFGDTTFTVSMYCLATKANARHCQETLVALHACGCLRKPVNDGGQELYQVMPGIVHPRKGLGGA